MRIVLDTNVLVSAVFFGGLPQTVLAGVEEGSVELVVCPEIYREYEEVCARLQLRHPRVSATPVLKELAVRAIWVADQSLDLRVCKDPDDDKFLACALHSGAVCVVTGDRGLLETSDTFDFPVLTVRAFVERYLA